MEQMTFLRQNDEIVVPVSLDYIPNWNAWHVLRELRQNAMDADEEGYKVYLDGTTLVVEDNGPGLEVRHFLLGTGDKDETARGRWREGLPLAMLVLTRLSLRANVYSNGNVIWNEHEYLQGEEVYKICWKNSQAPRQGCRIEVPLWGETYPLYEERFVAPHDKRLVHQHTSLGSILKMEVPAIFNHDIWVCDAVDEVERAFQFGYNIRVDTNRDREMVDIGQVKSRIGYIWSLVDNEELWIKCLRGVKNGMAEADAGPGWNYIKHKDIVAKAIRQIYGKNTVASTSDVWHREAVYRGANVVDVQPSWKRCFEAAVGTDKEFVYRCQNKQVEKVPIGQLTPGEKYVLQSLRREAKKFDSKLQVRPVIFESESTLGQSCGGTILIARQVLYAWEEAMRVLVHELAHEIFGTRDATPEMQLATERIGARIAIRSWQGRRR